MKFSSLDGPDSAGTCKPGTVETNGHNVNYKELNSGTATAAARGEFVEIEL
jgi:hypothetical protein